MKANSKNMKDYDNNKESSYHNYWGEHNFYESAMAQRLLLGGFKWVKETSQFHKYFIKSCHENSDIGYLIGADV